MFNSGVFKTNFKNTGVDFFIIIHITREATTTCKIEGTRAGIDDVVLPESGIAHEKRDDWREVHNYINAINFAIDELSKLPLSIRLLNETHKILMSGVRGEKNIPARPEKLKIGLVVQI
jgi:Fic family protein